MFISEHDYSFRFVLFRFAKYSKPVKIVRWIYLEWLESSLFCALSCFAVLLAQRVFTTRVEPKTRCPATVANISNIQHLSDRKDKILADPRGTIRTRRKITLIICTMKGMKVLLLKLLFFCKVSNTKSKATKK